MSVRFKFDAAAVCCFAVLHLRHSTLLCCVLYVMELGNHVVVCLSGSCNSASDRVVAAGALRVAALAVSSHRHGLPVAALPAAMCSHLPIAINRALVGKPFCYVAGS